MGNDERHLQSKIRIFEDMLLRCKDYREQEKITKELTIMRIKAQKMYYQRMSL